MLGSERLLPRRRSRAASSSGRPATKRRRSCTSIGREHSSKARALSPREALCRRADRDVSWRSRAVSTRRAKLVEQAVSMAEELGDDGLLGDALNNRGIVRGGARRSSLAGGPRAERGACTSEQFASGRAVRTSISGSNLVDIAARPRPGGGSHARGTRPRAADGPAGDGRSAGSSATSRT